jgi:hypothetical protein
MLEYIRNAIVLIDAYDSCCYLTLRAINLEFEYRIDHVRGRDLSPSNVYADKCVMKDRFDGFCLSARHCLTHVEVALVEFRPQRMIHGHEGSVEVPASNGLGKAQELQKSLRDIHGARLAHLRSRNLAS